MVCLYSRTLHVRAVRHVGLRVRLHLHLDHGYDCQRPIQRHRQGNHASFNKTCNNNSQSPFILVILPYTSISFNFKCNFTTYVIFFSIVSGLVQKTMILISIDGK